jgi:drug/metabolite transporter (DMT)-like permease
LDESHVGTVQLQRQFIFRFFITDNFFFFPGLFFYIILHDSFFYDLRLNFPKLTVNIFLVLLYLALFGTVFTFLMQTAMQRFTTATRTALVFAMEPVFAALFAYLIAGETMTVIGWLGGILILAGMVVAEINWKLFFTRSN